LEYLESRDVFIQAFIREIIIKKEEITQHFTDKGLTNTKSRKKMKPNDKEVQHPEEEIISVSFILEDLNHQDIETFSYPIWNKLDMEYQLSDLLKEGNFDNLNERFKECVGKKFFFSVYLKRKSKEQFVKNVNCMWLALEDESFMDLKTQEE
jgi:hypothetical protein